MRMKCPICGRFAPLGETADDAVNLALEAGFVIVERIRVDGPSPRFAVCDESCYQTLIDYI